MMFVWKPVDDTISYSRKYARRASGLGCLFLFFSILGAGLL